MKKLFSLFLAAIMITLASATGCSKADDDGPVKRSMVAAAYYSMEAEDGVLFTFYLVDNKNNLVQKPNDPNAMEVTQYVMIEVMSSSKTPQGTYSFADRFSDLDPGSAVAFDNCGKSQIGYIKNGTVTIGSNTISINGSTEKGQDYSLSFSGSFQKTGYITTFVK